MISISEAYTKIEEKTSSLSTERRELDQALGYFLAENLVSPIDMPPFRQSAMDGYALHLHDGGKYTVKGEIKAGDHNLIELNPGEAVRIFTGAPVPDTANAVVMQERVQVSASSINLEKKVNPEENIRPKGEQVKKGEPTLPEGTLLTPAAIGYLSSLGLTHARVVRKPRIAVVSTGNELVSPGEDLPQGKIYESNTAMLRSALKGHGFDSVETYHLTDDFNSTLTLLEELTTAFDVVLISGGISVGDHDYVGKALRELKVEEIFYKVNQKPGKPLFFGQTDTSSIFALPGNPAAALTCFYVYVRTCLELLSGNRAYELNKTRAISGSQFTIRGDRPQFLKAIQKNGKVEILEGQSSAMLNTFSLANALVFVPGGPGSIHKGDEVEVIGLNN